MSFDTAIHKFRLAAHIAEERSDKLNEHFMRGMEELANATQKELRDIASRITRLEDISRTR